MVTEAEKNSNSQELPYQKIEDLVVQLGGWRKDGDLSLAGKKLSDETVILVKKDNFNKFLGVEITVDDLRFNIDNDDGLKSIFIPLEVRIGEEKLVSDDWPYPYEPGEEFRPVHSRMEVGNRLVDWVVGMTIEDRYTPPPISFNIMQHSTGKN